MQYNRSYNEEATIASTCLDVATALTAATVTMQVRAAL